jgi:hypothetical protein
MHIKMDTATEGQQKKGREGKRENNHARLFLCVYVCVCIHTLESVCFPGRCLAVGKYSRMNPFKGGMDEVLCVCVCVCVYVSE